MAIDCAACCEAISTAQNFICSKCNSNYHPECVNKDYCDLSKSALESWICPFCQSKTPKSDNTHTPVRQQGQGSGGAAVLKCNVTLRPQNRGDKRSQAQSPLVSSPVATGDNDALSMLTREIKLLRSDMGEIKDHLKNLTASLANCVARLNDYDVKLACSDAKIRALEEKELENALLQQKVARLEERLNLQSQDWVRNEIEVQGINEQANENLFHIMKVASSKIGVELSEMDIDCVSRVGPRRGGDTKSPESPLPRPVVLRFVRHMKRQEFLKAAKSRRNITSADIDVDGRSNKLFFNERLTKENRNLFRQARQQKTAQGYKYCWTSNGRIFMRKREGGPVIAIRGEADLSRIRKLDHASSSAAPASPVSAVESLAVESFRDGNGY